MRYELEAIVVTDTKLFGRTGAIGLWAEKVEAAYTRNAILHAPSSLASGRPNKSRANAGYPSGSMKTHISGAVRRVGLRQLETVVMVDVPYAVYVIKGTGPLIFAKSARSELGRFIDLTEEGEQVGGMYLPGQPAWKSRFRQRVRGQKPNNFLGLAFDTTARTHSSLRGYHMIG